jgi:hypothetical protein
MRRYIIVLALAMLASTSQPAEAPAPLTVANCSTDSECENGPDTDTSIGD